MVTLPSVSVLMTLTPLYSRFDGHSRVYLSHEAGREFRTSLSARGAVGGGMQNNTCVCRRARINRLVRVLTWRRL